MKDMVEARVTARLRAKEWLLEVLYVPAKNYLELQLQEIVKKNNLAHGDGKIFGGIIYKGRTFGVKPTGYYMYAPDYLLVPELTDEVENFLTERLGIAHEQTRVSRFLSILFTKINNKLDLEDFLGSNLYHELGAFHQYFDAERLSTPEMLKFTQEYRTYVDQMQNRMVENLLAKDLYDTS